VGSDDEFGRPRNGIGSDTAHRSRSAPATRDDAGHRASGAGVFEGDGSGRRERGQPASETELGDSAYPRSSGRRATRRLLRPGAAPRRPAVRVHGRGLQSSSLLASRCALERAHPVRAPASFSRSKGSQPRHRRPPKHTPNHPPTTGGRRAPQIRSELSHPGCLRARGAGTVTDEARRASTPRLVCEAISALSRGGSRQIRFRP